ncbi:MAG: hypothetical protein IBX60_06515 [Candidatus Aminicenantes bacterium]|nr:hypothetical protein [Candidatus Aminicenantes bacterium]
MKKPWRLLIFFNVLLLCISWVMAVYAYPKLPMEMPLWLNFCGQPVIKLQKSPLFFLYPVIQSLFNLCFLLAFGAGLIFKKISYKDLVYLNQKRKKLLEELKKEIAFLALIFFNLVFIHIHRSLILLAHEVERGVEPSYFYSLFVILLLLIPYYHMRKRMILKK